MDTIILGSGGMGRTAAAAFELRGDAVRVLGRPVGARHDSTALAGAGMAVEASRGDAVAANVAALVTAGCRRIVIATTGWEADRPWVEALLREHDAAAVAAPSFSLGVALFGRLVEVAAGLFGAIPEMDPYVVEWHRRTKADRPSGTARELSRRILAAHPGKARLANPAGGSPPAADELDVTSIRAGASPGMHLVGFDAPGESVELRLTARDRSAYAAGILAAADWLAAATRAPGIHAFDPEVVDDVLMPPTRIAPDGTSRHDHPRGEALTSRPEGGFR